MKLYYSPGACSLAVHIALYEIGQAFEAVAVRIADGAHQEASYLSINPRGLLPALDTGDFVVTEATAILMWLAQQHPDKGLWPANNSEAAARCAEWLAWISGTLHTAFALLWRPERFCSDAACNDSIKTHGQQLVATHFSEIERRLATQTWACGASFSVADIYLLPFWRWGTRIGMPMHEDYPAWSAHSAKLAERRSVQQAIAAEGIVLR
jgi:glutathione S-transferase